MFGHGETAQLHRATTRRNTIGQTIAGFAAPEPLEGVAFAPESTQEPRDGTQIRVVATAKLYAPPGHGITAGDEITVRGQRFTVEGTPGDWVNPYTGWAPGAELMLRRVSDA